MKSNVIENWSRKRNSVQDARDTFQLFSNCSIVKGPVAQAPYER